VLTDLKENDPQGQGHCEFSSKKEEKHKERRKELKILTVALYCP